MIPRPHRRENAAGVVLLDVMIGLTILAFVTTSLFSVFLSGIAQAWSSDLRSEAAAWAQSELEYLRYVGYGSGCLTPGLRTVTHSSSPCTSPEPALPPDLAGATIEVENDVGQAGLKRITIQVMHAPGSTLYQVVSYETHFR